MERIHIRGMGRAFGGGSDRMERKKKRKTLRTLSKSFHVFPFSRQFFSF